MPLARWIRTTPLLAVTLLLACGSSAPPPTPAPPPAENLDPMPPDMESPFAPDVVEFDPTTWSPPETGPNEFAARVLATIPDPETVPAPSDLPRAAAAPSGGGRTASPPAPSAPPPLSETSRSGGGVAECFQLQLLASGDYTRAAEVANEAERLFGEVSLVVSSGGLHRVRLGECLSEVEANSLAVRARRAGYPEAFVARASS